MDFFVHFTFQVVLVALVAVPDAPDGVLGPGELVVAELVVELLDADAFSVFKAAQQKNGSIFDKKAASLFRKHILERGGTEPAADLYRKFRGGEPTINALLERDGIKAVEVK